MLLVPRTGPSRDPQTGGYDSCAQSPRCDVLLKYVSAEPVLPSTRAQAEGSEAEGSIFSHAFYLRASARPRFVPLREMRAIRFDMVERERILEKYLQEIETRNF